METTIRVVFDGKEAPSMIRFAIPLLQRLGHFLKSLLDLDPVFRLR